MMLGDGLSELGVLCILFRMLNGVVDYKQENDAWH